MTSETSAPAVKGRIAPVLDACGTTIVAGALVVANWMSWPAAVPLLLIGAVIDFNRSSLALRLGGAVGKSKRKWWFPFRFYVSPRQIFCSMGGIWLVLTLGYYTLQDACWPHLNAWMEANIGIFGWRFLGFTDLCSVSRGSYLAALQYLMPVIALVLAGAIFTSARFEPDRFWETSWNAERPVNQEFSGNNATIRSVMLILIFASFYAMIIFRDNSFCVRCIKPHVYYYHFVLYLIFCHFILLGAYIHVSISIFRQRSGGIS